MNTSFLKILICFSLIFAFSANRAQAQEDDFFMLIEPEFAVGIGTEGRWAYSFAISHRDIIYAEDEFVFEPQHIELAHSTAYALAENHAVSLGLKYRFEELYDETETNEIRLIEEYENSGMINSVEREHRVRFEQRFRESTTFRARYRFALEFPLNGSEGDLALGANTETLWSFGQEHEPELDQRLELTIAKGLSDNSAITFGFQYRYEDYTHNPVSNLFFISGFKLSL